MLGPGLGRQGDNADRADHTHTYTRVGAREWEVDWVDARVTLNQAHVAFRLD